MINFESYNKSPLKLNLNSLKHLALRLYHSSNQIEYFKNNKVSNVTELLLVQCKNGKIKNRIVYNPSYQYKKLLRSINSNLLQKANLPEGVLGGVIGKSITDMASIHCNQEAVLSIDLKDFFPNITSGIVFKFFRLSGCNQDIAGILTDLVTLNCSLPQGFPTSPMLANLIAFNLDIQHLAQAEKYNLRRTRWIDDIIFSGRSKDLAKHAKLLLGAIRPNGFWLNNRKTEYKVRSNKPTVVGLEVSGKTPHVPIVVIDKVREILYECRRSGIESVQAAYENDLFNRKKNLKSSLEGRIRHISIYNKKDAEELTKIFNSINW